MRDGFARILADRKLLIPAGFWILSWILPWAAWLGPLPWLRVGLAILLFALPGLAASMILAGGRFTLAAHFTIGLALSISVVGSLGFMGRVFNWPFAYIRPVFFAAGLAAMVGVSLAMQARRVLYRPKRYAPLTWVFLAILAALGSLVAVQHRFGIDDYSYLAYLTNWEHAARLNFREVFFGTDGLDQIRFWLAMFPMNLAFLAEISGIHGMLLLGLYLEPFLVVIALLAVFNLYEDLLQSERLAISALVLHFTFLFMRPVMFITGSIFFNRLSHDKAFAAFVLAPVFFLAVRNFMEAYSLRSGLLVLMLGAGLALTHPIILAFSIFIAGASAVFTMVRRREYRRLAALLGLLLAILIPSASLRLIAIPRVSQRVLGLESPLLKKSTFDLESALDTNNIDIRISYIEGTPFYGFNPSTVAIRIPTAPASPFTVFLSQLYLWILGLGFLWSLANLKHEAAPFVAASSLIVILCAVPYTGWLVGFFVSARQLGRSAWLLPVGLIVALLAGELQRFIRARARSTSGPVTGSERIVQIGIPVLCFILLGYYSAGLYADRWKSTQDLRAYRQELDALVSLGNRLQQELHEPARFAARTPIRDSLPGLSSKSKVVYFRQAAFTPWPVDLPLVNQLLAPASEVPIESLVKTMEDYQLQYIVVQAPRVGEMYSRYSELFQVEQLGSFWIVRLREPVGKLQPVP